MTRNAEMLKCAVGFCLVFVSVISAIEKETQVTLPFCNACLVDSEEKLCARTSSIFRETIYLLLFTTSAEIEGTFLLMTDACKVAGGRRLASAQP